MRTSPPMPWRVVLSLALFLCAFTATAQSGVRLEPIGHHNLGGRALAGDLAVHRGFAYVGQWTYGRFFGSGAVNACAEEIGVPIVDVRSPRTPELVGIAPAPPGTVVEDLEAYTALYGPRAGREILVAGVQQCTNDSPAGLILWDVTQPSAPVQLGFLHTGEHGVHELTIADRHDLGRTFAFATVPLDEHAGRGDLRIYDITDPARPFEVAAWGVRENLGVDPASFHRGCNRATYAHGVETAHGATLLFVSYWDAGVIILDISDPADPRYVGRTEYGASDEGNAHSTDYDETRKLLFVQDEDLAFACDATPVGWGYLRVYDVSDPTAPRQIGTFRTPNSQSRGDGNYSIHHGVLVGTTLIVSWFADGVRLIDVSDPASPREIASHAPPPTPPPVQPAPSRWPAEATRVWGVAVDRTTGLIYASDYHSGLWILQRSGPPRRRAVRH